MKEKELSEEDKKRFPILAHMGIGEMDKESQEELSNALKGDLVLDDGYIFHSDDDYNEDGSLKEEVLNLDKVSTPISSVNDVFSNIGGNNIDLSTNEQE